MVAFSKKNIFKKKRLAFAALTKIHKIKENNLIKSYIGQHEEKKKITGSVLHSLAQTFVDLKKIIYVISLVFFINNQRIFF